MGNGYKSEASYLLCRNKPLSKNATLTIKYKIDVVSGQPDFVAMETNNTPNSGTVGFIIFHDLTSEFGRFWYNKRLNLDPGTYTLRAPLADLASWTSVYGKSANDFPKRFENILSDAIQVGITFGGGNHFGHGVRVYGGTAKFTILSAEIEK